MTRDLTGYNVMSETKPCFGWYDISIRLKNHNYRKPWPFALMLKTNWEPPGEFFKKICPLVFGYFEPRGNSTVEYDD